MSQQNNFQNSNRVQTIVEYLKNGNYSDVKQFIELIKNAEKSAENDEFFEAIIFSLIMQIKNYERILEQIKNQK